MAAQVKPAKTFQLPTVSIAYAAIIADETFNARKVYNDQEIADLAKSIKEHGNLEPMVVREDAKKKGVYFLVSGFKRHKALAKLGAEQVTVAVTPETEDEALWSNLSENVDRSDLSPWELAERLDFLKKRFNLTDKDVAAKVGKSRSHTSNMIRLKANLHPAAFEALKAPKTKISLETAFAMMVKPQEDQKVAFDAIMAGKAPADALRPVSPDPVAGGTGASGATWATGATGATGGTGPVGPTPGTIPPAPPARMRHREKVLGALGMLTTYIRIPEGHVADRAKFATAKLLLEWVLGTDTRDDLLAVLDFVKYAPAPPAPVPEAAKPANGTTAIPAAAAK